MPVTSLKLEALYPLSHETLVMLSSYLARDLTLEELEQLVDEVQRGSEPSPQGI
jgi:hypothetical protein